MPSLPPLDIKRKINHAPHVVLLGAGASLAAFPTGDANGCKLPQAPVLSEAETADVENFLVDVLSILPLTGLSVFEKPPVPRNKRQVLEIAAKGITAEGYESEQGFVVLKGSKAAFEEVPSIHRYMSTLRKELQDKGVLVQQGERYEFDQDYVFNSPSTAAGIILARTANGRIEWKDPAGRTLREIQEQQTTL